MMTSMNICTSESCFVVKIPKKLKFRVEGSIFLVSITDCEPQKPLFGGFFVPEITSRHINSSRITI